LPSAVNAINEIARLLDRFPNTMGTDGQTNGAFSAHLIDAAPRRNRCGASCLVL